MIPCSPISPSVAVTIDVLELYRTSHLRCPHLSIQAFVKTLSDLHRVSTAHFMRSKFINSPGNLIQIEFHRYLSHQFSVAFDIYLQILAEVEDLITEALNRDQLDWYIKHVCPACTYVLKDEETLTFKLLYAMDGNDSLKCVVRREVEEDTEANLPAPSLEVQTGLRLPTSSLYLSQSYVDRFKRQTEVSRTFYVVSYLLSSYWQGIDDRNSCASRWKNMDNQKTSKAWGIYDETRLFLAACRHGFTLVLVDMVQSGEQCVNIILCPHSALIIFN